MRGDQFIPQLIVNGGVQAMNFYVRAFGAEELTRTLTPDRQKMVHGEILLDGHKLYVTDEFDTSQGGTCKSPHTLGGTGVRITLHVDDADRVVDQAVLAGAHVIMPVQDMYWGGRYGKILDPFGHEWGINQELKKQSGGETQEAADMFLKLR
jgi:PhnB protein